MEVKSWLDSLDRKKLMDFAKKHHRGVDGIEVKKDFIIITCSNAHTDSEWDEVYTPFGKIVNKAGVIDNFSYAAREFFAMLYEANVGNSINGKSYDQAWKEANQASVEKKLEANVVLINEEIKKLQKKQKDVEKEILNANSEFISFVDRFVADKKQEKSLIVKDMLKGLSKKERTALLKELGYVPEQKETKEKPEVINNGLNEVVLDFDKPATEVDECDDYYV